MTFWTLAFLVGTATLIFLQKLPPVYVAWVILPLGVLLQLLAPPHFRRWLGLPIAGLFGFAWALLAAQHLLAWQFPAALTGKNVTVIGTIVTIPEQKSSNLSFEMDVKQLQAEGFFSQQPVRVRLSWYRNPMLVKVGERWQLIVRLKQPRGFWSIGSFDYQAWLLEQGVRATGYVVAKGDNRLLATNRFEQIINRSRENLAQAIVSSLQGQPLAGLVTALAVGVRDEITEPQWTVLRGTGTNHLFAIAGLHIGFVSGMIYALISFIWRRLGRLPLYFATPQAAALGALISAVVYSALAGFAMPTQRAIIMIAVFLLATLLRKNLPAWAAWGLALFTILIIEPLAVLSDSFWLSFSAVALIIYGSGGRLKPQGLWWRWGRIQWVIAVGLIPLSLLFFHQASLAGFIANAIAIPWVGFITLPLSLLGSLCWPLLPKLAALLWQLAEWSLAIIWPLLTHIAALNWAQWLAYLINPWLVMTSLLAVVLLLAPQGFPARWLGFIWALPLLIWVPAGPKANEVWITQLDVGRGLSTVVRTAHHLLLYDTGPGFNSGFNAGDAVIVPALRSAGIRLIDKMIVSSGSNGHIGGAETVLNQIPTLAVMTSVPLFFPPSLVTTCQAGQNWEWDNVIFQVLDASCSLRIVNGKQSVLLLGDGRLARGHYLADVIVSMSTITLHTVTYTTVEQGTITVKLQPAGPAVFETYAQNQRHFWTA